MKLSELYLNRYLYRSGSETPDSVSEALDASDDEPSFIVSGGAAQDLNTGNVMVDPEVLPPVAGGSASSLIMYGSDSSPTDLVGFFISYMDPNYETFIDSYPWTTVGSALSVSEVYTNFLLTNTSQELGISSLNSEHGIYFFNEDIRGINSIQFRSNNDNLVSSTPNIYSGIILYHDSNPGGVGTKEFRAYKGTTLYSFDMTLV